MPQPRPGPVPGVRFSVRWLQRQLEPGRLVAQAAMQITFLVSALTIAAVDRIMPQGRLHAARTAGGSEHRAH
jgi:hypothetical protein